MSASAASGSFPLAYANLGPAVSDPKYTVTPEEYQRRLESDRLAAEEARKNRSWLGNLKVRAVILWRLSSGC